MCVYSEQTQTAGPGATAMMTMITQALALVLAAEPLAVPGWPRPGLALARHGLRLCGDCDGDGYY